MCWCMPLGTVAAMYMYHLFLYKRKTFYHRAVMFFLYDSQKQTEMFSLKRMKCVVLVIERCCVLCEVGTELLILR
jgi:hypothetical protein